MKKKVGSYPKTNSLTKVGVLVNHSWNGRENGLIVNNINNNNNYDDDVDNVEEIVALRIYFDGIAIGSEKAAKWRVDDISCDIRSLDYDVVKIVQNRSWGSSGTINICIPSGIFGGRYNATKVRDLLGPAAAHDENNSDDNDEHGACVDDGQDDEHARSLAVEVASVLARMISDAFGQNDCN